jgi:small subunit ribosomal protein S16
MVKIRLAKQGRKKLPIYKIVAADERSRRDGRFIEALGQYRPQNETGKVQLNEDRVMYWLGVGAQPTDTMRSILSGEGILLKWHLQKKKVDPARAEEIFTTWKTQKESSITNKLLSKKEAAKKKKAEQDAAKASAAEAKAKAAEPAAEIPAEAAPVAEAPAEAIPVAEAPAEAMPVAEAAAETPAAESPAE